MVTQRNLADMLGLAFSRIETQKPKVMCGVVALKKVYNEHGKKGLKIFLSKNDVNTTEEGTAFINSILK